MATFDEAPSDASKAMLSAALGGLLCFGASCGSSASDGPSDTGTTATATSGGAGGSTTAGTGTSNASSSASNTSAANSTGVSVSSAGVTTSGSAVTSSVVTGSAVSSGAISSSAVSSSAISSSAISSSASGNVNPHTPIPDTACSSGIVPNPQILTSTVGAVTEPDFQSLCAQANGIFEIQPLCGGSNACRGFAYDSGTQTLTEHSCQHTNTCAGYNCVVCS